jgi:hypothetical protein
LRRELAALRAQQATQALREQKLQAELAALRAATPSPTPMPSAPPRFDESFITLRLMPDLRSAELATAKLRAAQALRLRLQLNFAPAARPCVVKLLTAAGAPLTRRKLTARQDQQGFVLVWPLAAPTLKPGDYKVEVSGYDVERREDVQLVYRFRVERP